MSSWPWLGQLPAWAHSKAQGSLRFVCPTSLAAGAFQAELQLQLEGPSWKINPKDAFTYDEKVNLQSETADCRLLIKSAAPGAPDCSWVPSIAHLGGDCCLCVSWDPRHLLSRQSISSRAAGPAGATWQHESGGCSSAARPACHKAGAR